MNEQIVAHGMQAMIFAAGLGTRLKPLTDHMPKALVRVGGQPLLWHTINNLHRAGVEKMVVNVHHFSEQIVDYLNDNHCFGLDIHISDETQLLLETGGGLKKAAPLFDYEHPILIHNVDILSNVNLSAFYRAAAGSATLLVSTRPSSRQLLFDNGMRLVGWHNMVTGQVKSPYPDLKPENFQHFAFSGIHTFSPTLFERMNDWPERFTIIDFYLSVCRQEEIRGYLKSDLQLMDVGKLDTLQVAEQFLRQLPHTSSNRQQQ